MTIKRYKVEEGCDVCEAPLEDVRVSAERIT